MMLGEPITRILGKKSDFEIVAVQALGPTSWEQIVSSGADAVEGMHPDLLIVSPERTDQLPQACHSVLENYPYVRVIAIAPDRNNSMSYGASLRIESNQVEALEAVVLGALWGKVQPVGRVQ
jgi:hypothetical protein